MNNQDENKNESIKQFSNENIDAFNQANPDHPIDFED